MVKGSEKLVMFLRPSNATITDVVLRDLDLHLQGQTLSC